MVEMMNIRDYLLLCLVFIVVKRINSYNFRFFFRLFNNFMRIERLDNFFIFKYLLFTYLII